MRTSALVALMPEEIRLRLAAGSTGAPHLAALARRCADLAMRAPEGRDLLMTGLDMALAAFEADPYEPRAVDFLLAAHARAPFLTPQWEKRIARLRAPAFDGEAAQQARGLARAGESEAGFAVLESVAPGRRTDPFLWGAALELARLTGEWRRAAAFLAAVPGGPAAFLAAARGDCHFQTGDVPAALAAYHQADWPDACHLLNRMAECRFRLGDLPGACRDWCESLRRRPWQTSVLLRLHAASTNLHVAARPLPGRTLVLLYTWNKAELLDSTLAALAPTLRAGPENRDICIAILDNGSTDATPDVVAAWAARLGGLCAETVRLPVNVGAPAARNWLLSLPVLREYDFCAFLDDDALLPGDWAARLGEAVAAYPKAGAWGCKVADLGGAGRVQHADIQLLPPADAPEPGRQAGAESLALHRPQESEADFGQFDYLRPAASVTGCFHLFRTQTLLAAPRFDLRFSPSQLDDLDHDLALLETGHTACYQGLLTVRHARATGSVGLSGDAAGRFAGNAHKLNAKWPRERVAPLLRAMAARLLDDLAAKEEELARA